jgi:hypothetical protein
MDTQYATIQTVTLTTADYLLRFHINILHRLVDIIPIIVKQLCFLGMMLFNIAWAVVIYFTHRPEVRSNQ